jgi:hypothetical protein
MGHDNKKTVVSGKCTQLTHTERGGGWGTRVGVLSPGYSLL